tara:strand:+ start:1043 stop:1936 length:894 start_codon:yes stop_codon:yes gene_type:complete
MAMEATKRRNDGDRVYWDESVRGVDKIITAPEGLPFLSLPKPDRVLTKAFDKKYQQNGNFKYRPGTYTLASAGCWHGKCTFCVEKDCKCEVRPVESVINEIEECKFLGFREIFDDSATFPIGGWLDEFCKRLKQINRKGSQIFTSCNMRICDIDYNLLADSGFRMVLFGVESANQKTLDMVNKGVKVEDIKYIKKAGEAGLEPHVAVMFGYPWESTDDAIRTLQLVHYLLRKGYAKTAQASLYCPPEGCNNADQAKYVKKIYNVAWYPDFWLNKIKDIKNKEDLKYLWRSIKKGVGL